MPTSPEITASPLPAAAQASANSTGAWGYLLVGAAAFLLGGAVTVLGILLRRKKNREDRRP